MISLILFFTIFVISVVSWLLLINDSKHVKVKGPIPLPIIGNGHLLAVNSHKFLIVLRDLAEKYGNVFRFYLLSNRYIVLSNPKYVESLLSSTELIIKGRSYDFLRPWLGSGLLTAAGQRWKTHRKFLTPTLHFNILQNFLPVFCKNEKILCKKLMMIADKRSFNLFPIIALAALDNVTESIMGVSVNAQTDTESKYVKAIDRVSNIMSTRMRNAFVSLDAIFNLLPMKKEQDLALEVLHRQTREVIEARREELKRNNITSLSTKTDNGIKNKHAFLDLLLLAEIDGKRIEDEHVREEVDTFMFEGHDTTTSGIVFSLFCISRNKDVQDKIFEEQKTIFGDDLDRDPSYSELQQMKYLEMVIKESLRLYPSVPMIERRIPHDTQLGDLQIPAETSVLVDILNMQRSAEFFEDPLIFKPERFDATTAQRNTFSWVPFSAGPRNCIGQRFAMMELKITLAGIIRHFEVLPSDEEPMLAADLVLRSCNGVHIKILPRQT